MSNATDQKRSATRLAALRDQLSDGMGRRRFLRTAANAGYALGMAHLLGVEDFLAVDDGEVPVVTALVREDPDDPYSLTERTKAVPADWYARVSKAFELHGYLADASITGYLGSAVSPGSYSSGTASISVELSMDDFQQSMSAVESLLENVSTTVEAIENLDQLEDQSFEREPRLASSLPDGGVPGGVRCRTDSGVATLGPALYHSEERQAFFTTADHAYFDQNDPGEPLSLPMRNGNTVELGEIRYAHPVEDVVAVEPTGEYHPTSVIDGAEPSNVIGQFTRIGLADLAARGEPLEKIGAQTGHTSGQISGIDAITCFTDRFCRRGQLRWGRERDLTDGDSGSVTYHPDPEAPEDGILVAGYNNARTWWPGQNFVWGVGAYHLTNQYGYHF